VLTAKDVITMSSKTKIKIKIKTKTRVRERDRSGNRVIRFSVLQVNDSEDGDLDDSDQ